MSAVLLTAIAAGAGSAEAQRLGELFGRQGPRPGESVTISGRVNDDAGRPQADLTVLFEATRNAFRLSKLGREKGDTLRIPAAVEADGSYRVDWRFDSYYNLFALAAALPVRKAGEDTFEVFHRVDVTDALRAAEGPLEVALTITDTTDLDALRSFLASLASDDEKHVYQEMGLPDRDVAGQADYDPDRSWWYFAAGKVYRFRDGELEAVVAFDPVAPP